MIFWRNNYPAVGHIEYSVEGRTFDTEHSPQDRGFRPLGVNSSGRFVGYDYTQKKNAWGTATEGLHYLDGAWLGATISNQNDIVSHGQTGAPKIWRWQDDGAGNGSYQDYLIDAPLPPTDDLRMAKVNASGLIAAYRDKRRDDQGNPLPSAQWSATPVLLVPAELAADADRDGTITLSNENTAPALSDSTSAANPFRFWSNDDDDELVDSSITGVYSELEEDDKDITDSDKEDWRNNIIDVPRDLEDFARINLYMGGLQDAFKNGQLFLGLKWSDTNGTNPVIKLYRSTDSGASPDYLFDVPATNRQSLEAAIIDARYPDYSGGNFQSDHTLIGGSGFFVIPTIQLNALSATNPTVRFIFEGCTTGKGQLKLVILKKENGNYTEIGEGPGVWMDIQKPNQFIERFTCGEGSGGAVASSVTMHPSSGPQFVAPTKNEERDYVLYIHGYNMLPFEKQRWVEGVYKRLYWLGYKGRVGGFSWPCTYGSVDQAFFDISEERAWQSGARLKEHIQSLNARGYRVHAIGHSQGNVVMAEALRLWRAEGNAGPLVETYIASQAAIPAACYNPNAPWMPDHDEDTPDIYSRYWRGGSDSIQFPETWPSTNPSYMSDTFMPGAANRWANFYNISDYALTGNSVLGHPGWEIDQRQKPNGYLSPARYSYSSGGGFKKVDSDVHNLLFPDDRHEIFSYGAGAWSLALGTIPTGGVFTNFNNMQTNLNYGSEHIYHSAQFRASMARRYQYWIGLLDAALIPHINP
jgi:hypothetical protein